MFNSEHRSDHARHTTDFELQLQYLFHIYV